MKKKTVFLFVLVLIVYLFSVFVWAQDTDPTRAVMIVRDRTWIRMGPSNKFKVRGFAVKDSTFSILESEKGQGCSDFWYRVYEEGWVCGRDVRLTTNKPSAKVQPSMDEDQLVPWRYAFINDASLEYKMNSGGWLEEIRELFKGFGFGVQRTVSVEGIRYYQTPENKFIPASDARISGNISDFQGVKLIPDTPWPIGWINSSEAWVYREPKVAEKYRVEKVQRFEKIFVIENVPAKKIQFYKIGENKWVRAQDVRVARFAQIPDEVGPDEKWIDVDTSTQIITAYKGSIPQYATMVSTGRSGASRTILGEFRIWVKVAAIAMQNTNESEDSPGDFSLEQVQQEEDRRIYSLQDVPWAQFFSGNYGLHATYWHNRFGNRRSSGCVNLSPKDAKWFYEWTEPAVPAGWWSIYTTEENPGTLIRVR